jgi:glycolate oxidase iron-sulfur subunit
VVGNRAALLEGCVQAGLFGRVHEATRRVLEVNGFDIRPAPGQGCCGAIHAHAGHMEGARTLARVNIAAFEAAGVDRIVVNAAGCGAALREYGAWLESDPEWRDRGRAIAQRCSDVTELLEEAGPVRGGPLLGAVVYHPPCHLEHAQGVRTAPRAVLESIPGLEVRSAEQASECCGGAGIYGVTHPELGGRIGADKARALADTESDCVATGNPGCMMQIAAFLTDGGGDLDVAHPVELLYESYRRAGLITDD